MKPYHLLLIAVLSFASCNSTLTGYPFRIYAVYIAKKSYLMVSVKGEGHVDAGEDLAATYSGTALLESLSDEGKNVELVFTNYQSVLYTIESHETSTANWGRKDGMTSLEEILKEAGYAHLNSDEVEEIVRVISGAFSGPKGTVFRGQSKFLKVAYASSH